MSVFHEVHCDVVVKPTNPERPYENVCVTDRGGGPFAWTLKAARQEAKHQGWVRRNGMDVCPGCLRFGTSQ